MPPQICPAGPKCLLPITGQSFAAREGITQQLKQTPYAAEVAVATVHAK